MADKKMETRVVKDANGFWRAEMRFLPVEEWEQGEGWRGCYVSSSKEKAEQFLREKRCSTLVIATASHLDWSASIAMKN